MRVSQLWLPVSVVCMLETGEALRWGHKSKTDNDIGKILKQKTVRHKTIYIYIFLNIYVLCPTGLCFTVLSANWHIVLTQLKFDNDIESAVVIARNGHRLGSSSCSTVTPFTSTGYWMTDQVTDRLRKRLNGRPTNWLTNWPTDRPSDWVSDWLTDGPTVQQTDQPTTWVTDWPPNQLTAWLTDRPTDCLNDWETDWSNNQPTNRPTDWVTIELNDQLTDWVIDLVSK
jgi:hypothetical protein